MQQCSVRCIFPLLHLHCDIITTLIPFSWMFQCCNVTVKANERRIRERVCVCLSMCRCAKDGASERTRDMQVPLSSVLALAQGSCITFSACVKHKSGLTTKNEAHKYIATRYEICSEMKRPKPKKSFPVNFNYVVLFSGLKWNFECVSIVCDFYWVCVSIIENANKVTLYRPYSVVHTQNILQNLNKVVPLFGKLYVAILQVNSHICSFHSIRVLL